MAHHQEMTEPILTETASRHVLFPIQHHDVWAMYKRHVSAFWTAEEIDFAKDVVDWEEKLNDNERYFLKHVLAFFAASDGIVNENLAVRFLRDVPNPEVRCFYGFQIAMENIHSETYSLMIDTFVKDADERDRLFRAATDIACVRRKAQWALRWIEDADAAFAKRLLAFACVEGIFFSGSFCAIFWLKERNVMPGLCQSNEFISRDESLHTEFAVLLTSKLVHRLPQQEAHAMVADAVDIEVDFICEALPCRLLGMNSDLMSQYIRFVADRLLVQLGYAKLYDVRNPFDFMDRIGLDGKANFFEHRESSYARAHVGGNGERSSRSSFVPVLDDTDF